MKRKAVLLLLVASALMMGGACSPSASEPSHEQEEASLVSIPTADSAGVKAERQEQTVHKTTPAPSAATSNTLSAKHRFFISLFPELPLPFTITLTGDAFDKVDERKKIKPTLASTNEFLGLQLEEDSYRHSFMGLVPVGKITTQQFTLLVYQLDWDGSCPALTALVLDHQTGKVKATKELEMTSCGPCAVVTGPITFHQNSISQTKTIENDCGNEGNPTRNVYKKEYAFSLAGIQEETPRP